MQEVTNVSPRLGILWVLVKRALKNSIKAHGPIENENLGSAIKRVVHDILTSEHLKRCYSSAEWDGLVADTWEVYYECEVGALKDKLVRVTRERNKLREGASTIEAKQEWIERLRKAVEDIGQEKSELRRQLDEFKELNGIDKAEKLQTIRPQITRRIARTLWEMNGCRDGYAEQDWLRAEKITDSLLQWKPDGEHTYFKYKV